MDKYYNPTQEELQEEYMVNGKYYGPSQEDIDDWRNELDKLHSEWTPSEKHPEFGYDYSSRDGYSIIHFPTGKVYELLEGVSWGGNATSDLVFIMDVSVLFPKYVTHMAGASVTDIEEIINYVDYHLKH